jgi:hypothetical protein
VSQFEGTDLAPVEMPKGVTGFGSAEMLYLLARHDTAVMARSRELLAPGVVGYADPASPTFPLVRAGASSLVARGLVQERVDGWLVSKAEAALLEYAAAEASRWTKVIVVGEQGADLGILLHADAVTAVLQARDVGTWFAGFHQGDVAPAPLVIDFIERLQALHPDYIFGVLTWDRSGKAGSLTVTLDAASDRWAVLDHGAAGDAQPHLVDRMMLLSLLARLLATPPGVEAAH